MTASDLGRAKTPAVAPHVEISLSNCISESQIILHTRGSMPCWRIVFSTFRGCMSFYTARVSSSLGNNCRRGPYQRLVVIGQPDYDSFGGSLCTSSGRCLWGTDWTRAFAVVNYEQDAR